MVKKQKTSRFYKGALILMLFGFLSKIIGAIYRIPLTSIVGAEGMGIYQMVFPLYSLMLTVSSSGLPSSISKLISEYSAKKKFSQVNKILKMSFILFFHDAQNESCTHRRHGRWWQADPAHSQSSQQYLYRRT